MIIKTKLLALLALTCCVISVPVKTIGGGWGIERGRANGGDVAQLGVDQVAMTRAQTRINEAISKPLGVERQKQLLGIVEGETLNMDALLEWWLTGVMEPAEAIAGNPAASCNESKIALKSLLVMMNQRSLLGMSPGDDDHSASAERSRGWEADLDKMWGRIKTKVLTRCHEEALDECLITGRFDQITQTEQGFNRQDELLGNAVVEDYAWADEALKQCAIYELHLVSTTKVPDLMKLESVRDAKITLRFEFGPGGIVNALKMGAKLGDFLKGETTGAENPFLVSVKCPMPGVQVVCRPGGTVLQMRSHVNTMELRHREFYVDGNGVSRERAVGEDKFSIEISGGTYFFSALVKMPGGATMALPQVSGVGLGFYIAHSKDRLGEVMGEGTALKIERNKRGVYPEIFDFTYADQDSFQGLSVSDSTEVRLIHKPEPKPFQRAPEPTRKPLKPLPRIDGQ